MVGEASFYIVLTILTVLILIVFATTMLNAKKNTGKKVNKKKMEFAQFIVYLSIIFSVLIVFYTITGNFILIFLGKPSIEQETITVITTFGGVLSGVTFSAYATLNAIRTWSLNKHLGGAIPEKGEAKPEWEAELIGKES